MRPGPADHDGEARTHLDWCPIAAADLVMELPDTPWSPLVRSFLDALPGTRVRPQALELDGLPLPARAARLAAFVDRVAARTTTDAGLLRFLQSPRSAPKPRKDDSLDVFHAGGRDAEVDEVLRRIFAAGHPLDRVEVVCASSEYAILAWERAQRLGWRVTVSEGIPAVMARPGRLLLRYCEWVAGGFQSADLRRLLQSGDCAPDALEPSGGLTPGQAARLLLKAEGTWGRDTYAPSLAALAARYAKEADRFEDSAGEHQWNTRKAAQARSLGAWIDGVLTAIPAPAADNLVAVREVSAAAAAFLAANASRASGLDALAAVALGAALADLADALGEKRRIQLHGQIDRINRLGPGEYEVADYKTGGFWAPDWKGEFAGGTRLQHAIYGAAAAALLKPVDAKARVTGARYLFPAVKGRGRHKSIPAPPKGKLVEVLGDLADVMGTGVFASADDADKCTWCEFAPACHPDAVDEVSEKLENPDNTVLEPCRRLRRHV
ncbi:MAG: PD-(D/E)XK nuclease family protein [Acidobacteria bacterium]|nr:PD-(D/E)XK nuclease family protein [Acidobacteriota bacterium]